MDVPLALASLPLRLALELAFFTPCGTAGLFSDTETEPRARWLVGDPAPMISASAYPSCLVAFRGSVLESYIPVGFDGYERSR